MTLNLPKPPCWHRNSEQNITRDAFIRTTSFVALLFWGEPTPDFQSWSEYLENHRVGTSFQSSHKRPSVPRSLWAPSFFLSPGIIPTALSSWCIEWLVDDASRLAWIPAGWIENYLHGKRPFWTCCKLSFSKKILPDPKTVRFLIL